jgi:hypothetical protein
MRFCTFELKANFTTCGLKNESTHPLQSERDVRGR